MASPLKILNPGEKPRYAEYIASALEKVGISCDTFRAATLDELTSAIEQGGFDIIFTGPALCGFDGLSARALTKERSSQYAVYAHFGESKRKE
jgi:DNA-binding response OmpR family regulator